MEFRIPQPLKTEHEELHEELVKATKAGGTVAEAAKEVARLLHPHFEEEEEYALPPLGILALVAQGKVTPEMRQVLTLTDRLKADFPHMLQEHQAVVAALRRLAQAAQQERKPEFARFAEKLTLHAQTEEDVLYPAALLIGEFVRAKLGT
jgi:hemerythrin superfamily protein